MQTIILCKLGELVLKGLNRRQFEDRLLATLRHKLAVCGDFELYASQSIIYVEPRDAACDVVRAVALCRKTFGIAVVSEARACEKDAAAIAECAAEYLGESLRSARSFKVESKRADKRFSLTSIELSQYVGGSLADRFPATPVDVHAPELTVRVEVRERYAFVHAQYATDEAAAGGLPVGSSGSAVCMLSGGIDSPVAMYMMARRGLHIIPVHFHSPPYTSALARQKVSDLAQILLPWCEKLTVEFISFTEIQTAIRDNCPEALFTVLSRRFMTRIASALAVQNGCGSIITGENLGQVASQTQEAMAVTEACASVPVFRPLIGLDKAEIIQWARRIGTFETSALPYEDCCTVFTPRHPRTRPHLDEVERAETALDVQTLVTTALYGSERVRVEA